MSPFTLLDGKNSGHPYLGALDSCEDRAARAKLAEAVMGNPNLSRYHRLVRARNRPQYERALLPTGRAFSRRDWLPRAEARRGWLHASTHACGNVP